MLVVPHGPQIPSQPQSFTTFWPVPNYVVGRRAGSELFIECCTQ